MRASVVCLFSLPGMPLQTKKVYGATWTQQVTRGIGCNWLVCLSVWCAMASEDVTGKILALYFPITSFVVIGFEHCIVNMFVLPGAMMVGADITIADFFARNLVPVTIGNLMGGLLVAVPYWFVYWLPAHPISEKLTCFPHVRAAGKATTTSGGGSTAARASAATGSPLSLVGLVSKVDSATPAPLGLAVEQTNGSVHIWQEQERV